MSTLEREMSEKVMMLASVIMEQTEKFVKALSTEKGVDMDLLKPGEISSRYHITFLKAVTPFTPEPLSCPLNADVLLDNEIILSVRTTQHELTGKWGTEFIPGGKIAKA